MRRETPTAAPAAASDDADLIRRCLVGDEAAWEALVDKYARLVYSVARKCGLDADDADDVFQNVFAALVRRLDSLQDHSRLSSWLITASYRASWRIGKASRRTLGLSAAVVDIATPPHDLVAQAEREQLVREAMARLDARCRELLTLLFLAPGAPSYEEIAAQTGMAIGSIGPTRARCFKKLEAILEAMGVVRAE